MKYLILLADGMADRPLDVLGGRTPLEAAATPGFDALARSGVTGLVQTIPEGMKPGSDTANMAVMGYDPRRYYSGRSPLEALSLGIALGPLDLAIRANLVSLGGLAAAAGAGDDAAAVPPVDALEAATMDDYSAGEIATDEAAQFIAYLQESLGDWLAARSLSLHAGVSYRHCLVWREGLGVVADEAGLSVADLPEAAPARVAVVERRLQLTPPHDLSGRPVRGHTPQGGEAAALLHELMRRSIAALRTHPLNAERRRRGQATVDALWFWGAGIQPSLPSLSSLHGLTGRVISAVDLVRGLGAASGLGHPEIPGATGTWETDYEAKLAAAIAGYEAGEDYLYVHLEGPDECGHQGQALEKVEAIERIDRRILSPLLDWLEAHRAATGEGWRLLILPDHPTPVELRTHTSDPVPFVAATSPDARADFAPRFLRATLGEATTPAPAADYSETTARASGLLLPDGARLLAGLVATAD